MPQYIIDSVLASFAVSTLCASCPMDRNGTYFSFLLTVVENITVPEDCFVGRNCTTDET